MFNQNPETGYRDPDTLHRLYHQEKKTIQEIADEFGVAWRTIHDWMERHSIDRRTLSQRRKLERSRKPAHFKHCNTKGYECWQPEFEGVKEYVAVHRLLAVAEFGFDAVCGKVVHHKNSIPWDNRPENIELLTRADHGKIHGKEAVQSGGSK